MGSTADGGSKPAGSASTAAPELSTIDFSGADLSHELRINAHQVQVCESGSGLGALYEEAAVLYANANAREAEAMLEAAVSDPAISAGEGLWMMLLDLYRLTGKRERFETRVLDYATRFERSPPPWQDLSSAVEKRKTEIVPLINLGTSLTGAADTQFEQIALIGVRSGAMRIDCRRVKSVDDTGCEMLLRMVRLFALERVKLFLLNAGPLAELLAGQIESGRAEGQARWLTLLEALQHLGDEERFETLALEYALTFEESPPAWEDKAAPVPVAIAAAKGQDKASDSVTALEGELTSGNSGSIRNLAAQASDTQSIEVECGRLRRLDFVSAGMLFNVLATLQTQGKVVCLRNVNAMVAALLRVMGIDQVATVTLRR